MTWLEHRRPVPLRRFHDLRPMSWPTGTGVTREVVSYPASQLLTPARPPWRLSVADLREPVPFSRLPGIDRTFVPVNGDVTLRVNDRSYQVAARTSFRFAGDAEAVLTRVEAPARAVNLMTRAGEPDAVDLVVHHRAPRVVPTAAVMMPLTTGRRAQLLDLYGPGASVEDLGVRGWLAVC